jgi:hypothetical protein
MCTFWLQKLEGCSRLPPPFNSPLVTQCLGLARTPLLRLDDWASVYPPPGPPTQIKPKHQSVCRRKFRAPSKGDLPWQQLPRYKHAYGPSLQWDAPPETPRRATLSPLGSINQAGSSAGKRANQAATALSPSESRLSPVIASKIYSEKGCLHTESEQKHRACSQSFLVTGQTRGPTSSGSRPQQTDSITAVVNSKTPSLAPIHARKNRAPSWSHLTRVNNHTV